MEEGAKRRLVGTAVIVALLVIFLPMLLEEDIKSPIPEQEMTVPPRPDFDTGFNTSVADGPIEPSLSESPERPKQSPGDLPTPQELSPPTFFNAPASVEPEIEPEPASETEFTTEPASESEFTTEPAPQTDITPEPAPALVEEAPPVAGPKPVTKPLTVQKRPPARSSVPARTSANISSWVIQVASLRERKHAYSLVQELRAKGFPAYIEEAEVKGRLWHRVRVGPEIGRDQIEKMATALKAQTNLSIQVQHYP